MCPLKSPFPRKNPLIFFYAGALVWQEINSKPLKLCPSQRRLLEIRSPQTSLFSLCKNGGPARTTETPPPPLAPPPPVPLLNPCSASTYCGVTVSVSQGRRDRARSRLGCLKSLLFMSVMLWIFNSCCCIWRMSMKRTMSRENTLVG